MRGFQPARGAKAGARKAQGGRTQGFANGGLVQGDGTGTSDDVEDTVPNGSYIMPADSTAAVGEPTLAAMGRAGVPVNLSNGEFKLPPEQVHAIGVQALDQMRAATHAPVGFNPLAMQAQQDDEPEPRQFFADGGVVWTPEDKAKAAALGTGAAAYGAANALSDIAPGLGYSSGGRMAWDIAKNGVKDAASAVKNAKLPGSPSGLLGKAGVLGALGSTALDVATTPTEDYRKRFGMETKDPSLGGDLLARGLGAASDLGNAMTLGLAGKYFTDKQEQAAAQRAAPANPAAAPAAPPAATTQAAPPAAATAPAAPPATAPTQPAAATPPVGQPNAGQVRPGIYRVGNSFSDTQAGAAAGVGSRAPSLDNVITANALQDRYTGAPRGFAPALPEQQGGMAVIGDQWRREKDLENAQRSANSIFNTRHWGGPGAQNSPSVQAYQAALARDAAANQAQSAQQIEAMREGSANQRNALDQQTSLQREAMQQSGANARAAGPLAIEQGRLALDQQTRGFDIRAGQRLESLQQRYERATSDAERAAIAKEIRDLAGKNDASANRFTVVPGGQEWDATAGAMRNVPARVLNNQTGEFVEQPSAAAADPAQNPAALAIRNDPNLSRDQKVAKLKAMGYSAQ